jgi:hypothetical protein
MIDRAKTRENGRRTDEKGRHGALVASKFDQLGNSQSVETTPEDRYYLCSFEYLFQHQLAFVCVIGT